MSRRRSTICLLILGLLATAAVVAPEPARAICPPFPCNDCWIRSAGQLNLVVMDRDEGEVRIVPNLRFQGEAADFALVVPTPSLPDLEMSSGDVWGDAFALTAPLTTSRRDGDSSPLGCGEGTDFVVAAPDGDFGSEVVVHGQETLGGFEATIISSDDPLALVRWLQDHGFVIEDADAKKFEPYVERDWFFTAMKPDTTDPGNQMPPGGWDNNVNPIVFRYEADSFELPLPLLTINRAGTFPVVVFAVDDHRMNLDGFETLYANKISSTEFSSISRIYPSLAPFIAPGRFLTRLDKTFFADAPMNRDLPLEQTLSDTEFRRTGFFFGGFPLEYVLFVLPLVGKRVRRRRHEGNDTTPAP